MVDYRMGTGGPCPFHPLLDKQGTPPTLMSPFICWKEGEVGGIPECFLGALWTQMGEGCASQ